MTDYLDRKWTNMLRDTWTEAFGRPITDEEFNETMAFQEATDTILRIQSKHPELRMGQILANAVGSDLFYIKNSDLAKRLREHLEWLEVESAPK